jgi:site-specific recombinase XerD
VIADLRGKGGHIRTIPVPAWVKQSVDSWSFGAGINAGPLLRSINKAGRIWGDGFTPKVICAIVKANAKSCSLATIAPHDLRRTCARLCHQAGGELEQIQFLLGHVSVQTTERYLGCKQRFRDAVNDHIRSGDGCAFIIGVAGRVPAGRLGGTDSLWRTFGLLSTTRNRGSVFHSIVMTTFPW